MAVKVDEIPGRTGASYTEDDITILEGLEAVRKRPGMYIGSTGPTGLHHLVWEVVDNSVDEAMAGRATRIDVTLLADGGCRVTDDGRDPRRPALQIPQDLDRRDRAHHPARRREVRRQGLPGLRRPPRRGHLGRERPLHPPRPRGRPRRPALGGRVREGREGQEEDHGDRPRPQGPDHRRAGTGTTVTFWPDATVFDETEFRAQTIVERMQIMAFLNKGLEIRFVDERTDPVTKTTYKYNGGIVDFVKHLNASKESLFRKVANFEQAEDGQEVEIALQWNAGYHESIHSFANGISTIEGGMHVEGFSKSLTNVVNRYARARNILKEEENLKGEDIREGRRPSSRSACATRSSRGRRSQARQPRHPVSDRARRRTRSHLIAREDPPRRARSCRFRCRRRAPASPPGAPAMSPAASRRSTGRACRASWPTALHPTRANPSSSSSRAIPPVAPPSTPATRTRRRSSPCAARC